MSIRIERGRRTRIFRLEESSWTMTVSQLLQNRGLDVPEQDIAALQDHWNKLRSHRQKIDDAMLGDCEVALTFKAGGDEREQ